MVVQTDLTKWSKEVYGNIPMNIRKKQRLLEDLSNSHDVRGTFADLRKVEVELNELLNLEDKAWRQRAKVLWHDEGDRNTAFFHACASRRRKNNWITGIRNNSDVWGYMNGRVVINPVVGDIPNKVSQLILSPGHGWNTMLIDQLFGKQQGEYIKAIPLSDGSVRDQWFWEGNVNGVYSVKSGYVVAHKILYGGNEVEADNSIRWDLQANHGGSLIWRRNRSGRLERP
ncbi:hypothetical protein ACFE04_020020 [Oxalis oulophora]